MKTNYIPRVSDAIAVFIGMCVTFLITGGIPWNSEPQELVKMQEIMSLNLSGVESGEGGNQSYERIYNLYERYYESPKKNEPKAGSIQPSENKQDTLEVDNKLYQLQATFISDQAMAVIMVKSKEGKLEDTVLLKKGEKIGRYVITQVNRTEVILAPDKGNQPLFLKLFERDIKE
ncbi:hypothetical protein [Vibrio rotiferianus]|uniref:hypothetical protein n=1 Tax=Vibrio rotiferianus TaxID=190895 RepID=UPI00148D5FA7|nr:hypothetical protein [Vibrio rotiferianus]NOH65208.1 hypothetical protein [Vibrio rotiferianus]